MFFTVRLGYTIAPPRTRATAPVACPAFPGWQALPDPIQQQEPEPHPDQARRPQRPVIQLRHHLPRTAHALGIGKRQTALPSPQHRYGGQQITPHAPSQKNAGRHMRTARTSCYDHRLQDDYFLAPVPAPASVPMKYRKYSESGSSTIRSLLSLNMVLYELRLRYSA